MCVHVSCCAAADCILLIPLLSLAHYRLPPVSATDRSAAVSTGLVPRVGIGRAVGLAVRSKLLPFRLRAVSQRAEVGALKAAVNGLQHGNYVVITGPMGVGKSTVVETALWRTCGVVYIDVFAEMSDKDVISSALAEIARTRQHAYLNPHDNARRVRFFYDLLPLQPPIIVLNVHERPSGKEFAGVVAATRKLANFGYRVIIDGSTNALPNRLLHTNREDVLPIGPMPLEVMETVPEFRRTFEMLKELDRFELVWAVCGGNPALMVSLRHKLSGARLTPEGRLSAESARELGAAVDKFALERVWQAVGQVTELVAKHPELKELLEMFKTVDEVTTGVRRAKEFVRPHDDKVLRTAHPSGALIAANAATALVLRHGLEEIPTIEELRELVGQVRYACDCVREPSGDSISVTFQPLTLHLSCALHTPVLHRRPRKIEVQRMRGWQRHTLLKGVEAMLLEEDSKAPSDFLEQCRCSYSRSAPIAL